MVKRLITYSFLVVVLLSSTSAFSQSVSTYITKGDWPAALTIESLDQFLDCEIAKDTVCMAKLVVSGEVILLKPGIVVYKIDHKFPGYTKIRPKGYTMGIWTLDEAIMKQ
jgi:hypothetical protein